MSYFYSYLKEKGRAGFVMSSQASSAGGKEADVRKAMVQTGDVDVMMAIRSNFFYTRTVPCELWFFNKGKHLSNAEIRQIKKVAAELLKTLKQSLASVQDTFTKEGTRDAFKQTIFDYLWSDGTGLPDGPYQQDDIEQKADAVYNFLYARSAQQAIAHTV